MDVRAGCPFQNACFCQDLERLTEALGQISPGMSGQKLLLKDFGLNFHFWIFWAKTSSSLEQGDVWFTFPRHGVLSWNEASENRSALPGEIGRHRSELASKKVKMRSKWAKCPSEHQNRKGRSIEIVGMIWQKKALWVHGGTPIFRCASPKQFQPPDERGEGRYLCNSENTADWRSPIPFGGWNCPGVALLQRGTP